MVLLMLLAALLPATTVGQELETPRTPRTESPQAADEFPPIALQAPADELPTRDPHKPVSKPCKRISQLSKNLLEKQAVVVVALEITPPVPADPPTQARAALPVFPLDSLLVRRSGITRAPPAFA